MRVSVVSADHIYVVSIARNSSSSVCPAAYRHVKLSVAQRERERERERETTPQSFHDVWCYCGLKVDTECHGVVRDNILSVAKGKVCIHPAKTHVCRLCVGLTRTCGCDLESEQCSFGNQSFKFAFGRNKKM